MAKPGTNPKREFGTLSIQHSDLFEDWRLELGTSMWGFHVEAAWTEDLLSAYLCVLRVHRFGKLSGTAGKEPIVPDEKN